MKNIKAIAIVFAASLMMGGCYSLDRYPDYQLSSGTFWKTQDHADQAMMAVYDKMHNEMVYGCYFGYDCLGRIGFGYDTYAFDACMKGTTATNWGMYMTKWQNLYEGITRANVVLQNIDRVDMSDDLKAQYKGEAKFMRALYYFNLLDFYGGVPIYDETVVVSDEFGKMLSPRSSAEDVRAFIIKDLNDAIASLPTSWATGGRATKTAAQALKGKVLLYNKQYKDAADMFEAVVKSGNHALYPSYENLFKPGGDESSEMIFAVQNLSGVSTKNGMPSTFYLGSRASYGSCWDNVGPATDFVDTYEYTDGRAFSWEEVYPGYDDIAAPSGNTVRKEVWQSTLNTSAPANNNYNDYISKWTSHKDELLALYEQRDPRLSQTMILPYTMYKGWYQNKACDMIFIMPTGNLNAGITDGHGVVRPNKNWFRYLYRKFVAEYDMDGQITDRAHTPINFPVIRYADVLLMLAECYNELDRQGDAVKYIDMVRTRAGMPGLAVVAAKQGKSVNSKAWIFERIKLERGWEFAAEGLSFSDERRWGILEEQNGSKYDIMGFARYTRKVLPRDYLWPIPQSEVDLNEALEQNPGW